MTVFVDVTVPPATLTWFTPITVGSEGGAELTAHIASLPPASKASDIAVTIAGVPIVASTLIFSDSLATRVTLEQLPALGAGMQRLIISHGGAAVEGNVLVQQQGVSAECLLSCTVPLSGQLLVATRIRVAGLSGGATLAAQIR